MASQKVKPSVPGKKTEVKSSKPLKPVKAFRSAEFIEDSDEEATKVARKKQSPKAVPPSNKPTRSQVDTSTTKPSKKRKSPSPSPEKGGSAQSDTEEDRSGHSGDGSEDEDSSSDRDGSPTPTRWKESASRPATDSAAVKDSVGKPQINNQRDPEKSCARRTSSPQSTSPSESGEDSESGGGENESGSECQSRDSVGKPQLDKPKAPEKSAIRRVPSPQSASSSEREEDSESDAGEDESGSESESSDHTLRKGSSKESRIQNPVTYTQEKVVFKPPPGFVPASISVHPSSQAMNMFSPTNLAGKEIWHITTPSSVPISSIKEVSQQSIISRSSVLTYNGSEYGLIPDLGTEEALLLPSAEDNNYKSHSVATIRSLHLEQIVSLPHHVLSPAKSTTLSAPIPQAYKREPCAQPEGLKMRYHPFGIIDISDEELSSKDVPKIPQFRVPGAVDATPSDKRKRVLTDYGAQSPTVSSTKAKSKKAKVRQEATVNEHDDVMSIDTVEQPASQKEDTSKAKTNGVSENHTLKTAKSQKTKPKVTDMKPKPLPHQSTASQSLLPADIAEQAEIIMPEEVVTTGASTIEITASEEKKVKRKRRREAAKVTEMENGAKEDADVEMRDTETPLREFATPSKSMAQKDANATNGEMDGVDATPRETKEERRKRKEEKRKRKREAGKV